MKIKYFLVLLGLVLIVSACKANQFQKLDLDGHNYNVSFGQNIPLKLKQQAVSVFSKDMQSHQNQNNSIEINNYLPKQYEIYSGNALRSLETEMSVSVSIKIKKNKKITNKTITSTKRFSSVELNPLAKQEMLKFIEEQLINDLINQLIIEVNLIDL